MHAYRIVSIEKTEDIPHAEAREGKWYRYVITNGVNNINGCRSGKLSDVRDHLEEVVQRLNRGRKSRSSGKKLRQSIPKPCFVNESLITGY